MHYRDGKQQLIALLENWATLDANKKSGSHYSAALLDSLESTINDARLKPYQYRTLKLYFYYGYTQKEIATQTKKAQQSIAKSLKKSVNSLYKKYAENVQGVDTMT